MEHPVELQVHNYFTNVINGSVGMSKSTKQKIVKHVEQSLDKQFEGRKNNKFRLRASNIGRATCQLWFMKNKPEKAIPPGSNFLLRMLIGDITEAVFKGVLTEAGVNYGEPEKVQVEIAGETINGEYDLIVDGKVDDIKSASPWSYRNKWIGGEEVEKSDSFGYIGQLAVYAKGKGVEPGGWWVVNHSSGEFKYVKYTSNLNKVMKSLEKTVNIIKENVFARCYEPVKEKYRKVESGRYILCTECKFCDFRFACWGDALTEQESKVSKAKEKPMVYYIDKGAIE
jgi:hypothetical protein